MGPHGDFTCTCTSPVRPPFELGVCCERVNWFFSFLLTELRENCDFEWKVCDVYSHMTFSRRWMLSDRRLLTLLVSDGYFLFPLALGMFPVCRPQPQTCVQFSRFQASSHLMHTLRDPHEHTHKTGLGCLNYTVGDHKTRLKLKAHFSSFKQSVNLLIWLILLFPVPGI